MCKKNKNFLKKQEILNKYKYSMPISTITIPNNHFRILCKEYKVRYRLPPFYSTIKPTDFISLLNKRKELANIIQNKIKERWIMYKKHLISMQEECPICYEKFSEIVFPIITFCMHSFCESCINTHLRNEYNCPICRRYIILNLIDKPLSGNEIQNNIQNANATPNSNIHPIITINENRTMFENQVIIRRNIYLPIENICNIIIFKVYLTYIFFTFFYIAFMLFSVYILY